MWQRVGFEVVDISDEISRIVTFQDVVFKGFREKRLLNSYSFESLKQYLGLKFSSFFEFISCYFDFVCNPYFEPRSSTTSRAWIWILGFRLVDSLNTW